MRSTKRNGVGRGMVSGRGVLFLATVTALVGCECGPSTVSREARLELSTNGVQFGVVSVGQQAVRTVGLRNSGSAVAVVSALQVAAPFGVNGEVPVEIGPGETLDIEVLYAPTEPNATAEENHVGELQIVHDTEQGPLALSLVGHAIEPVLSIDPAELSFGEVDVGDSKGLALTLENKGTDKFEITSASIEPAGAFTTELAKLKGTFQPGAKTTVTVSFAPSAGEAVTATLKLETTVPGMPTVSVPLSGTGLAPKVSLCYALEGGAETCLDSTRLTGTLDFGALDEGTSRKATFTLRNDGNTSVQLISLMPGGRMGTDLTAQSNPCNVATVVPDFVFTPDRFGQKLPEDPSESDPNPSKSQAMELVYTPHHEPGCYEDSTDRARVMVKLGAGAKAPVYQIEIQGASKIGRIGFTQVSYTQSVSSQEDEYRIFNTGAGQLTIDSLELVEGYFGDNGTTPSDCQPGCESRTPCSDPSVSDNEECKAFSFVGTPKTSFSIQPGSNERTTDGAKDLRYTAPAGVVGKKVVGCIRVKSNDPVYPTICARVEGYR